MVSQVSGKYAGKVYKVLKLLGFLRCIKDVCPLEGPCTRILNVKGLLLLKDRLYRLYYFTYSPLVIVASVWQKISTRRSPSRIICAACYAQCIHLHSGSWFFASFRRIGNSGKHC